MDNNSGGKTKAETMDKLIDSYGKEGINSSEIINIIQQAFNFDLGSIPGLQTEPRGAIAAYLEQCGYKITGAEIRNMINETFGINLNALSAMEGAQISIYSKNRWMVQHEKDLFVVQTGTGDVDVRIFPTPYYAEQTGTGELPNDLINALIPLGFFYEENMRSYFFSNPAGEPVSDAFKGQTMMAIRKVIQHSYSHL